jgi:hypothetical protein
MTWESRLLESHTDEVNHQQTVDQVQQLLSSEFRGDEFDDLNLSCSANVDDECHSSDSEGNNSVNMANQW